MLKRFAQRNRSVPQLGVLCHSLMPATNDMLNRLHRASELKIKAYPIVTTTEQFEADYEYVSTNFFPRHLTIRSTEDLPDNAFLAIRPQLVAALVNQSDVIMLLGLQGLPALFAAIGGWLTRKPVVMVIQSMLPKAELERASLIRLYKRILLPFGTIYVVQTPATRDNLGEVYGIPESRMIDAPFESGAIQFRLACKADTRTREELRRNLRVEDCVVFLFVGSLIEVKGIDILVRSVNELLVNSKPVKLWIVGTGPKEDAYRQLVKAMGITDHVTFWGNRKFNDLVQFYRAADAFVFPTRRDMWPKAITEAAICGLPMITTPRCGCAGYLVRDSVNGFVVPQDDSEALSRAMTKLLDPDLRQAMGERSEALVDHYCNGEAEIEGLCAAIRVALSR